jgi:cytoskeleton protein RodZ
MAEEAYSDEFQPVSIGERLRQAREAKGLALEDLANETRIPIRHLQHIELEEWDAMPAATYAIGFVRSYANAVGLDGAELGRELRDRLGGTRSRAPVAEYYQPADPARVPPRSLAIIAGVIALVLVVGYAIWRSSLGGDEPGVTVAVPEAQAPRANPGPARPQPVQPQNAVGQPVTLTATGQVWLRVYEASGATLMERTMAAGETYQVPATATRPMLRVGAPEALRVTVGQTVIPPLGPPGQPIGDVSARPEDLIARAQGQAPPVAPAPTP